MPGTTIYTGWGWDEVFATAVLSKALTNRGYSIFLEFPTPSEIRKLVITGGYAVGFSHRDGAKFLDSYAAYTLPEKRLGFVTYYGRNSSMETVMKAEGVTTTTEVVLMYASTALGTTVKVPEQVLSDIKALKEGRISDLSKSGKVLYRAYKMNYVNRAFRELMYRYAINIINTGSVKPTPEIAAEAKKYDEALELAKKLLAEKRYVSFGNAKVIVISREFDEFIAQNFDLLRPISYDILMKVCNHDGFAMLIQETELGHTLRVCLKTTKVSFVDLIDQLTEDLSERLDITLKRHQLLVKFKDSKEATLDNMLHVASVMATPLVNLRVRREKREKR